MEGFNVLSINFIITLTVVTCKQVMCFPGIQMIDFQNKEMLINDMDSKNRTILSTLAELVRAIANEIEFEVAPKVEEAFRRILERSKEQSQDDKTMIKNH